MNTFRLQTLRRFRRISQKQLGELIGRSESHVKRLETGRARVSPDELDKIARALGVDAIDLMEEPHGDPS